ncbi:MAG: hypothetical protein HFG68_04665 [Hungatella sp.]|nr:hypothetical protein [Hungatella sp.]
MGNKKDNPYFSNWRIWIVTATMIIQLLTALEYYHLRRELQDSVAFQKTALQLQIECMENWNRKPKEDYQDYFDE